MPDLSISIQLSGSMFVTLLALGAAYVSYHRKRTKPRHDPPLPDARRKELPERTDVPGP
jgi:hypothetical protein